MRVSKSPKNFRRYPRQSRRPPRGSSVFCWPGERLDRPPVGPLARIFVRDDRVTESRVSCRIADQATQCPATFDEFRAM